MALDGGHEETDGRTSWSVRDRNEVRPPSRGLDTAESEASPPTTGPVPADPPGPSRAGWRSVGGVIVVLLLFGAGIGAVSLVGDDGRADVIRPPCPAHLSENPHEDICIEDSEGCHAWMRAPQRYREVSCGFRSDDGSLTLSIDFTGQGHVTVALDKPGGDNIFYRTWGDEGRVDIHDVLTGLRGPSGEWTLRVIFEDASGSADVRVYG